jgi:hypothetical protein
MKNLFFLAAVFSLALSTISCKSKKESTSSSAATASASPEPAATNESKPVVYRLIVSFISKGAGTDSQKRTAFLDYIAKHPKKPAYKEMRWGREGEADYGFMLTELDAKKELTGFIEDVKKIADGSDMMVVTENVASRHVR